MKALHRTDIAFAEAILRDGFDLRKFGAATKKAGQAESFKHHARGIFFTEDWGADPKELPPHPWDHRDRGVYVFAEVRLANPFVTETMQDGVFYQKWLSDKYGGKTKAALATAMKRDGYDGIFVREAGEITVFEPDAVSIDIAKSMESVQAYRRWKAGSFKEWFRLSDQKES